MPLTLHDNESYVKVTNSFALVWFHATLWMMRTYSSLITLLAS